MKRVSRADRTNANLFLAGRILRALFGSGRVKTTSNNPEAPSNVVRVEIQLLAVDRDLQ